MARLGELERAVMEVLWARGAAAELTAAAAGQRTSGTARMPTTTGATVREVTDALADRRLAYTTVMTVLDRLAGKGMAVRLRDGRAWRYRPAATREAYIAQLMLEALDLAQSDDAPAADAGDRGAALVRFARSVSGEEARVLRAALDEQAGRGRSRKQG